MGRSLRARLAGGKKLTFLYVPDGASVRQFMVPKALVYALAGAAVLTLVLMGFFGTRYLAAARDGRQLLGMRGENMQLQEQLGALQQDIVRLRTQMHANLEAQQQLRTVASLQELDPEILQAGIGGPAPSLSSTEAMSPETRQAVEAAGRDLSQLLRQAKIQEESFGEILKALENKRAVWDHTPSVRPLGRCTITSRYGRRMDPFTGQTAMHRGVDFAALPGSPIRATAGGVVTAASRWGAYGLMVEVDHGGGLRSRYAHCSSTHVKPGQRVQRGEVIARVGSSGRSSGSHVHYEILRNGLHLDPMEFVLPSDVVVD